MDRRRLLDLFAEPWVGGCRLLLLRLRPRDARGRDALPNTAVTLCRARSRRRSQLSSRLGPAPPSTVDPHRREAVAGFGLREGGPAACDVPRSLHGFRRAQCAASAIEGRVVGTDDPFRRAHQSRIAGSGRGPVPAHEGIPARLHRSGCRVRGALGCKGHRRHRRPLRAATRQVDGSAGTTADQEDSCGRGGT